MLLNILGSMIIIHVQYNKLTCAARKTQTPLKLIRKLNNVKEVLISALNNQTRLIYLK